MEELIDFLDAYEITYPTYLIRSLSEEQAREVVREMRILVNRVSEDMSCGSYPRPETDG